jgi:hypothetical protein
MLERFVITGSGRCGTTWISRALTRAGIPCGHEAVFNPWSPEWPDYLQAESSWVAACELGRLDSLGVPVALLVRHPLAVVKSMVEIGVYDWATPQDRALAAWVALNSAALTRAELVLRFDLIKDDPELFARLLRWAGVPHNSRGLARYALWEPPCNRHEKSRERTGLTYEPSWNNHDLDLATRARGLARILGYQDGEG